MDASVRSRSTRDRPAKAPLSEAAIVDAALAVARTDGLAAVTMRRVAAELDTGAASLYVYVRNRDELLHAMLDRVAGEVPLVKPDPKRWRKQLLGRARRLPRRARNLSRPGDACCRMNRWRPTARWPRSRTCSALMVAGGIAPQDAAWGCDNLMLIVTATANEADVRKSAQVTFDDDFVERLRKTFAGMPPEDYPNIVSHADALVAGDGTKRFHFGIETFLDGLVARSARS